MKRLLAVFLVAIGFCILGITIGVVVAGIRHPTTDSAIAITLLSALGAPAAFIAIQFGLRLWVKPDSAMLRTEAQARHRAAAALEDAETAEKIKLELDAYIALRARRLEIERRRRELSSTMEILSQSYSELNSAETQLGIEVTRLDPETVRLLDSFVQPDRRPVPDFYVYGIPVGQLTQRLLDMLTNALEKRRLRRMALIAPEALKDEVVNKSNTPEA